MRTFSRALTPVVMATFMVLAVVPLVADAASFNVVYFGGIRTIEPDSYLLVKGVRALEGAGLSCNVTVLYGPNVDVLVMDKANFENYKQGIPFSYLGLSNLNASTVYIASGVGELVVGTEYYLLVDNSEKPLGGASPPSQNGKVQVVYEFGAGNVQIVDTGFSLILIAVIIVIVAAIVVVLLILFLAMRNKGKRRQTAPYPAYSGVKVCPRCGVQSSVEHQFCPNCGNRLQ